MAGHVRHAADKMGEINWLSQALPFLLPEKDLPRFHYMFNPTGFIDRFMLLDN
jgi:hypothetical protein